MRWKLAAAAAALTAAFTLPATAQAGHGLKTLDHEAPAFTASPLAIPLAQSGGPNADWEFVASFTTGNPHSDLDFFTQGGETYVSLGTLGTGANGAGQTIFQLTSRGAVQPRYVSNQPSAESDAIAIVPRLPSSGTGVGSIPTFPPCSATASAVLVASSVAK